MHNIVCLTETCAATTFDSSVIVNDCIFTSKEREGGREKERQRETEKETKIETERE